MADAEDDAASLNFGPEFPVDQVECLSDAEAGPRVHLCRAPRRAASICAARRTGLSRDDVRRTDARGRRRDAM